MPIFVGVYYAGPTLTAMVSFNISKALVGKQPPIYIKV
jgi:hypothetical protein